MSYDRPAYAAYSRVNNTRMHMSAMRHHKHRGDTGLSPHIDTDVPHIAQGPWDDGDDQDGHRETRAGGRARASGSWLTNTKAGFPRRKHAACLSARTTETGRSVLMVAERSSPRQRGRFPTAAREAASLTRAGGLSYCDAQYTKHITEIKKGFS